MVTICISCGYVKVLHLPHGVFLLQRFCHQGHRISFYNGRKWWLLSVNTNCVLWFRNFPFMCNLNEFQSSATNDAHVVSSDGTRHVEATAKVYADKFLAIGPATGLGTKTDWLDVRYKVTSTSSVLVGMSVRHGCYCTLLSYLSDAGLSMNRGWTSCLWPPTEVCGHIVWEKKTVCDMFHWLCLLIRKNLSHRLHREENISFIV